MLEVSQFTEGISPGSPCKPSHSCETHPFQGHLWGLLFKLEFKALDAPV